VGVFAGYTEGTRIAHNEICRLPYTGISSGWGWGEEDPDCANPKQPFAYKTPTPTKDNRIEYNNIHHLMSPLADGGGIYMLGDQPGTVIRGNHVHDNAIACGGIYLDEGSGFIEVTGNLVHDVPQFLSLDNPDQRHKDSCKVHDNLFGVAPEKAKAVVDKAGLEAEYRKLLKTP
jgi:hypothetical protein